ncbi:MAG: heavy metal sensor histidine kinase [Acidobacteria bacterium]|nr:heavy metal sensor histidine kinase [Acidobacteriota bacterium]
MSAANPRTSRPPGRWSLRARLIVWFVALLTATMAAFAAVLFFSVRYGLWGEFDRRLGQEVESARSVLGPYWTSGGISAPEFINPLPEHDRRWMEVWSPHGERLFRSPEAEAQPIDGLGEAITARVWSVSDAHARPMRVLDAPTEIIGMPVVIRVAQSEESIRALIRAIWLSIAASLAVGIGIAVWSGYGITRRALRPLEQLVAQTGEVTADGLRRGVQIDGADREVHAVAAAFNDTLGRLHVSFEQARRFSADASHELRTPLTSIRTVGQMALQQPLDAHQYREAIASIVEDTERLTRLLDALLLLSRADAQQTQLKKTRVSLDTLVRDAVEQCEVLAEEKQHQITVDTAAVTVDGDADVLRLAIGNLLDNAIRYTPEGGRIHVAVSDAHGRATVSVTDSGPGIAPEHQARVFDRFYRVDDMRSRQSGGTGLGLSIAAWAAAAHGGRVTLDSTPGTGSTFRLELTQVLGLRS